jgi:hypothetical protein
MLLFSVKQLAAIQLWRKPASIGQIAQNILMMIKNVKSKGAIMMVGNA